MERRDFCLGFGVLSAATVLGLGPGFSAVGPQGMHTQPWFLQSFLDLKEDHAEAKKAGKKLVIFFEQPGCPYCAEMHNKNLKKPEIVNYIKKNFAVQQINLFGSREVTDFDGKAMEERELARRWGILFTPTIVFIKPDLEGLDGLNGKQLQIARMPGYFRPFHFITFFEYINGAHYEKTDFQRFLRDKVARLKAEGKKVTIW